jgi:molecular chaperone DnaJ
VAPQREWFEKDYYSELGVAKDATEKEITRAYRKLAKQYHPDANSGDSSAEERFKDISAAHDVLGDAEKRKEYDQVREMVASGAGPGGPGGFGGGGFGGFGGPGGGYQNVRVEDLGDLGDLGGIFGNLFGGGGRGRRRGGPSQGTAGPRRGQDIETELHLDFLDAVHGITTSVNITSEAPCHVCNGTGAKPGTFPERCPTCNGAGSVAVDQGPFSFSEVCPTCGGRGSVVKDKCKNCKGRGIEVRPRTVKVRIPAGVDDGQRIRVKDRGTPGLNGAPPGDLYVVVHVAPHPIFARSGKWDLTVKVPITFPEATLGAQVKVPTLDSPVTVKVPPGTQTGKTVRVKGRGIPRSSGDPGALLVTFDVVVPQELDDDAKAAIETLAAALPGNPREHLGV